MSSSNILTTPGASPSPYPAPDIGPPDAQPRRRRPWRWVFFLLFVVVVALTALPIWTLVHVGQRALHAKQAVSEAQTLLEQRDFSGAADKLHIAQQDLVEARTRLHDMGFWRDFPLVGPSLHRLEDTATAGAQTLESLSDVVASIAMITDVLKGADADVAQIVNTIPAQTRFQDISPEQKRDMVGRLATALPRLRLARDKMDLASELWSRVETKDLVGPLRNVLEPLVARMPVLKRQLDEIVPLLEVTVPLLGHPTPRPVLFALQNADELRPAGGFIGTIGTATFDGGNILNMQFMDVYTVDNTVSGTWKKTPPMPLSRWLGVSQWFLRDANWSPDFPTSAQTMLDFYTQERSLAAGQPLSGAPNTVIAFEPAFFEGLLRIVGPLQVDGQTFTADNFFDQLEYGVEIGYQARGLSVDQRKTLLLNVGNELQLALGRLPLSRWPEVIDLITQALQRKRLMIYASDKAFLDVLDRYAWTGRTQPTQGDFLWVVDANLAAFKTDGVMARRTNYRLDVAPSGEAVATVTLSYTNQAKSFDWRHTRYRTYTRVYVPDGSQLLSSTGAMYDDLHKTGGRVVPGSVDIFHELGKTVFGAFWSIEPGKTGTLSFTYRLPKEALSSLEQNNYHLDWQKQPGVDDARLTLDLRLGKNIKSAVPAEDPGLWGDAHYEYTTDSLLDRTFDVKF